MNGSRISSREERTLSWIIVMMMPPITRMGALKPMRCIMPVMRYT